MKHTSKLAYLLWLPVLVWVSILSVINVVNGEVSIRVPAPGDLHRPHLFSLSLWKTETGANVKVNVNNRLLNVSNWIIMWKNNRAGNNARFASIWWWKENSLASAEKSGIWWWKGNSIDSPVSVIWWWAENSVKSSSKYSTVAWWRSNVVDSEWSIVGWENNVVIGRSLVIWWRENHVEGEGSMVLWSNSKWGIWSFSWNSSISRNYSAIIMASGGTLIWTYEAVSGVNLVVDWAVKIWNNPIEWIAGEIRLQSWCFYGYDGNDWYVINRWLWNECFDNEITCKFGSVVLQPHETVMAYSDPYAETCILEEVECNENWVLWEAGKFYYPYCHAWGWASCGIANWKSYSTPPTEWLCDGWIAVGFHEQGNTYRWSCINWNKSMNCHATKVSGCQWEEPTWDWVNKWSSNWSTSWSYVNHQPSACQWTCEAGYIRVNGQNKCVENDGGSSVAKCGSAAGQMYSTAPTEWLCDIWVGTGLHEQDNAYTWYCVIWSSRLSCSATRDTTNFRCVSTDQMMNNIDTVVPVSWPSPDENVEKKLYASITDVPEWQYCAYTCNEAGGWHYFPEGMVNGVYKQKRCAKCLQRTEQYENGILVSCTELIDVCPHNYYYRADTNQCVSYWNCLWNGNVVTSLEYTVNILDSDDLKLARPIWMNKTWTQKASLDDVEYNKCNFVCESGYISRASDDYKYGCVKPFCADGSSYNRVPKENSVMSENPLSYNYIRHVEGGRRYEKYWQYVENITSEEEFYERVADKNGCYYWCPEDRLCKRDMKSRTHPITTDSKRWTCYASPEDKEVGCVEATYTPSGGWGNSWVCNGYNPTLKWYAASNSTAYWQNMNRQTYAEVWWYEHHSASWCLQWCTNTATGVVTGPNGETICWKQCPQYQYFDINGWGCRSCANNTLKPDPNNMFHGNSLGGCVPKCGEGQTLCQDCWTDWGEACVQTVINLISTECETWGVLQFDQLLQQFKCVYDVYVYEDGD